VLRADDRSIYGKKGKNQGSHFEILPSEYEKNRPSGTGGIACVRTKQAVIIGDYEEPIQPGECTKVVEGLADYLISVN
jgi:profilin